MPSQTEHEIAIADTIARLFSHFATANEPLAVRRSIARDWLEDLAEFTPRQVAWAAREWRRSQSFRPTIADIRRLAINSQHAELERRAIAENTRRGLDQETIDMWSQPEFDGDIRSWEERRIDAARQLQQRWARADQWRKDNPHWQYPRSRYEPPVTAADLGVTATEAPEQ